MKIAAALICVAGLATAAIATPTPPKTYQGTGGTLLDGATGSPATTTFTIFVPPDPDGHDVIYAMVDVTLNISHTYVGDLLITLTGPGGQVATLFDRPGYPQSTFGNSDNLDGIYVFEDFQPQLPESAGAPGGVITPGTYGTSGPGFLFDFDGTVKTGVWTLSITDHAGGDTGTLHGWSITMTNLVPSPSAMGLLGLGGLVAARRCR